MRSSATKKLLDDRPHFGLDDGGRARRTDQPDALGLGAADLEIAPADSPGGGDRFALEAIESASLEPVPLQALGGVGGEEQGEVGEDPAGRANVQLAGHGG